MTEAHNKIVDHALLWTSRSTAWEWHGTPSNLLIFGGRGRNRTYNLSVKICKEAGLCVLPRLTLGCSEPCVYTGSALPATTPDDCGCLPTVPGIFPGIVRRDSFGQSSGGADSGARWGTIALQASLSACKPSALPCVVRP